jgi:hypothetical protein
MGYANAGFRGNSPAFPGRKNPATPYLARLFRISGDFRGKLDGAPGWDRTSNPCLRRAVLYPLSYGRFTQKRGNRTDATPKQDRKDTRFRPNRPPDGPYDTIQRLSAKLHDPGKRLLNTPPRCSPPPKSCVYNRPWLITE